MNVDARVQLEILYNFSRSLSGSLRLRDILRRVMQGVAGTASADFGCVVALSSHGKIAAAEVLAAGRPVDQPEAVAAPLLEDGLLGYACHNRQPMVLSDVAADARWASLVGQQPHLPQQGAALCLPLMHNERVVGALLVTNPQVGYFDASLGDLIAVMADQAAVVIANAQLFAEIRLAQTRYSDLFDDSIVPIILTDLEGNVVEANQRACQFLEYAHDDLLRLPITAIHRMGTGPVGVERFEHLQRGHEVRVETIAWTKTGRQIAVQVHAKRIQGEKHDVVQWIENDLTAQKELELLRQDMSDMIYHDLRNPLSNVITSLDVLNIALANNVDPKIRTVLQVGARASRQLSRLIDSLLDLRRLEEGRTILQRERASLHGLVAEAAQQVEPVAVEQHLRLRFQLDDDLPLLYIDPDMIKRVLINLMENAVKFTSAGGEIRVEAQQRDPAYVYVRVIDNGAGIPPEAVPTLFDKFTRVRHRGGPKGIGLGLAFCRMAVEAHGGSIGVESELGEGSTFWFRLPLHPPPTDQLRV